MKQMIYKLWLFMGPARNMGRWTDTGTEEIPVKSVSVSEGRRFFS